jgi:hypothetical protein
MIAKIFLFQFVNSYASFFYLAFIAQSFGDCPETGCMGTLGTNLAIIFGARVVVGQFKQNFLPYWQHRHRLKLELEEAEGAPGAEPTSVKAKVTRPEKELLLDEVCFPPMCVRWMQFVCISWCSRCLELLVTESLMCVFIL